MVAAVGRGAQGDLRACRSSCGTCAGRAVAVVLNGHGVGGGGIRLEDGLDGHIGGRHGELIAGDAHGAADHLPLLEVVAAVGRGAQGDLRACRSSCGSCGAATVAVVLDSHGIGFRSILLENGLDGHIGGRHGELVVSDGHSAADYLPLLEVVAAVGGSTQGDLRTCRSSCGSCGAATVAVVLDSHGIGFRSILLENGLDGHIGGRHGELVVSDGHSAADYLPLLEVVAAVGGSTQGDLRTCRSSCGSCGAATVAVVLDGYDRLVAHHCHHFGVGVQGGNGVGIGMGRVVRRFRTLGTGHIPAHEFVVLGLLVGERERGVCGAGAAVGDLRAAGLGGEGAGGSVFCFLASN